nr:hypothetical protein [Tanacetum cinerariifolium]
MAKKLILNYIRFWSAIFAIYSHGEVCLGWGRWGKFIGGHGIGGDGLESGGSGVMGDGGKSDLGMNIFLALVTETALDFSGLRHASLFFLI